MLFIIRVLKNLASFTGKHLCWSLILIKLRTPPVAASDSSVFLIEYQTRAVTGYRKYQSSYISLKYEDCLKLLGDNAFVYFA